MKGTCLRLPDVVLAQNVKRQTNFNILGLIFAEHSRTQF